MKTLRIDNSLDNLSLTEEDAYLVDHAAPAGTDTAGSELKKDDSLTLAGLQDEESYRANSRRANRSGLIAFTFG